MNIDNDLIRDGTDLRRSQERLVEITNGGIRYALRDALLTEPPRLAEEGRLPPGLCLRETHAALPWSAADAATVARHPEIQLG